MRGVMDSFNDPLVEEIVVQKGTQIGWTAVLGNVIGYMIDREPCPMLTVMPTIEVAEEWSKNRFTPMIRDTKRLHGKIRDPRSRDSGNTILSKNFVGGRLAIIGANAPSNLASRPIRVVFCDETDRYPLSAGAEGDPMTLAAKRQETFWNRKMLKGSSPTIKGKSVIERDYQRSDKRLFHVPCPCCKHEQALTWKQVKWDKEKDGEGKTVRHRPETATYQCEHCGEVWSDAERWQAISKGRWIATAPFSGVAGFHLSQLYSSWVKLSKVVTEYLTANGRLPGTFKDPQKLKVFVNTVLAETWDEEGETVEADSIKDRGEPFSAQELPEPCLFASAGVDVQDDRLEVQILAWGRGEEAWAARYAILSGDPAQRRVWDELDVLLKTPLRRVDGRPVRILAACIDTGGHHANEVFQFCARPGMRNRRVYPIKGDDGPKPIWPVRHSLTKTKKQVWIVGTDTGKDSIYGRLKLRQRAAGEPNPGFIHFPLPLAEVETEAFNAEYFAQLTSEKVITTKDQRGRSRRGFHLPAGKRNEALDTMVYAFAARLATTIRLSGGVVTVPQDEATPEASAESARVAPPTASEIAAAPTVKRSLAAQPKKPRRDAAAIARMFNR